MQKISLFIACLVSFACRQECRIKLNTGHTINFVFYCFALVDLKSRNNRRLVKIDAIKNANKFIVGILGLL